MTITDLVELNKDLYGNLWAENAIGDHLIERLRQTHPDRRSPIKLEGRHSCPFPRSTNKNLIE